MTTEEELIARQREQYKLTDPCCVAYGHVSHDYRDYVLAAMRNSNFINWSSILTKLIQCAGRFCEHPQNHREE